MTPETGPQSQDDTEVRVARGRARLHDRPAVEGEHPLVKFARVWAPENSGNSGVERIVGE